MNEADANFWVAVGVGLGIGLLIGAGLVYLMTRRGSEEKTQAAIAAAQAEYRDQVGEHFVGTAKLVDGLTDSYKALFDHLQAGADGLVDEETLRLKLDEDDRVITLNRLGRSSSALAAPVAADALEDPVEKEPADPVEARVDAEPDDDEKRLPEEADVDEGPASAPEVDAAAVELATEEVIVVDKAGVAAPETALEADGAVPETDESSPENVELVEVEPVEPTAADEVTPSNGADEPVQVVEAEEPEDAEPLPPPPTAETSERARERTA